MNVSIRLIIFYSFLLMVNIIIMVDLAIDNRDMGREDIRKEAESHGLGYWVEDKYGSRVFVWAGTVLPPVNMEK